MYEDDSIFESALNVLYHQYGQRANLLEAVDQVVLLSRSSIPIFGSLELLQTDLGLLRYLLRSSEVWAVKSQLSGDFNEESFEHVAKTLKRVIMLMLSSSTMLDLQSETATTNPIVKEAEDQAAYDKSSSRGRSYTGLNEVEMVETDSRDSWVPSALPDLTTGADDVDGATPNVHFQELLRKMDLQRTLFDALRIEYNTSFRGSQCDDADKMKSRSILITVYQMVLDCVGVFCRLNLVNQALAAEVILHAQ